MKESDEIIMLRVKKSKAKAFRNMLKMLDFVQLETPEDRLDRYIKSAPTNVPVTDDDIMNLIKGH
jgi:ABC-type dipeptide/oligopeptide/nickel transport system ATPase component